MKTLFTIPMLVTIVITGIVSCRLFYRAHYDLSALLYVASFVSAALLIAALKNKKLALH
ncbi:MAG TPA: hypothetical protein VMI35_00430 [Puia sp.]|nr:hypothetical protein [Puia sp.]